MPTETLVNLAELQKHVDTVQVSRRIDEVIVHHTWSPTAADYRGIATVRAVRQYHMQVRGWSDNGYHVMIAPNGDIFLCRPLSRAGAHTSGRNAHSIGVSFIANFDVEHPEQYGGMQTGIRVIAALLRRFNLDTTAIRFHREFANKTCPGTNLSLAEMRGWVHEALSSGSYFPGDPRIVLLPDSTVVDCAARLENGTTRADLRPLTEALGYEVHEHIRDQGKIYLRPR